MFTWPLRPWVLFPVEIVTFPDMSSLVPDANSTLPDRFEKVDFRKTRPLMFELGPLSKSRSPPLDIFEDPPKISTFPPGPPVLKMGALSPP
jgi:hypothetical protein